MSLAVDYNFEFVSPMRDEEDMKMLKQEVEIINESQIITENNDKNKLIEFIDNSSERIKCGEVIVVENKNFFLTCNCNKKFRSLPGFSEHYLKNHTTNEMPDDVDTLIESSCIELFQPNIEEDSTEEFTDISQQINILKSKNVLDETTFKREFDTEDENENDDYDLAQNKNVTSTKYKKKSSNNRETKGKNIKIQGIVCEICGKNLPNKSTMIRHHRTHTGERPFKCRHCEKGFNYKNHCQRHELLHIKEKIYECDYCYLKFSRTDHKKVHEASHTIEDKEKVAKFGKKAGLIITNNDESEKITKNLIQLDDSVPDGYWRCKICEKILKNSYKPEDHHRLHTGEKPFICDICGKGMFSQSNLLRHVATHTQNRRYRCTKCPAAFYCSTHLKRHEISHNSEKQFKCEMCDMKFWRKEHLTAHQVRHLTNRQRNHKCDICEKSYLDVNALRHHKKKHTSGNDSFMCSTCPAVFQLKEALKRHEKRHINKGLYKCDYCPDKRFNDKDDKNQHEKRCHINLL